MYSWAVIDSNNEWINQKNVETNEKIEINHDSIQSKRPKGTKKEVESHQSEILSFSQHDAFPLVSWCRRLYICVMMERTRSIVGGHGTDGHATVAANPAQSAHTSSTRQERSHSSCSGTHDGTVYMYRWRRIVVWYYHSQCEQGKCCHQGYPFEREGYNRDETRILEQFLPRHHYWCYP